MKTYAKLLNIVVLSLCVLNTSQGHALNQYFESSVCPDAPMTRQEAMNYLGANNLERTITTQFDALVRSRRCYPEFGCQDWYVLHMADVGISSVEDSFYINQSRASPYSIKGTQLLSLTYLNNTPVYRLSYIGGTLSNGIVDGQIQLVPTELNTRGYFHDHKIERISFVPSSGVSNRSTKLTNRCFWDKTTGSEQKTDSSGNAYRYDLELVFYATF